MQVLQGSLVALVTPMLPNGDIDYSCLESLIDWHVNQGTNGIVSVGTTGESATLNVQEHLEVMAFTIKHVNKRIPVIAGTGANSTNEAIELTSEAKKLGADHVKGHRTSWDLVIIMSKGQGKSNKLVLNIPK